MKWTPDAIDTLQKFTHGVGAAAIARELGTTERAVFDACRRYGVTRPQGVTQLSHRGLWTPEEKQVAQLAYETGASRKELSTLTGRSEIAIKRAVTTFEWVRSSLTLPPPSEAWKQVAGFPYAVNRLGEVISLHVFNKYNKLSSWRDDDGYVHVTLSKDGKTARRAVHRLVAEAFLGPRPTKRHQVAHWDGDPGNNKLSNLRWATPVENFGDRLRHGKAPRNTGTGGGHFIKVKK